MKRHVLTWTCNFLFGLPAAWGLGLILWITSGCASRSTPEQSERPHAMCDPGSMIFAPEISEARGRAAYERVSRNPQVFAKRSPDCDLVFVCVGLRSPGGDWAVADILVGCQVDGVPPEMWDGPQAFMLYDLLLQSFSMRGRLVHLADSQGKSISTSHLELFGPGREQANAAVKGRPEYAERSFFAKGAEGLKYKWAVIPVPVRLSEPIKIGIPIRVRLDDEVCERWQHGCDIELECRVEPLGDE